MKKILLAVSTLFALWVLFFLVVPDANAATYFGTCGNNLIWEFDSEAGILKISGEGGMEDYPTRSDAPWHAYRNNITAVIIENGVTSIGSCAFDSCINLSSVIIPGSVNRIGSGAFYGCDSLESINIPEGVTQISSFAFSSCDSLNNILFPNTLKYIGDSAFSSCYSMNEIVLPVCVEKIGASVFSMCGNIEAVTIFGNGTILGKNAFYGCTALKTINIYGVIASIGQDAFYVCNNIETVNIDNLTSFCNIDFGSEASNPQSCAKYFKINNELVTELVIPEAVTHIREYLFSRNENLTSVTIPRSVTSIDGNAFIYCDNLATIVLPDTVETIGEYAFFDTAYYNSDGNWIDGLLYIGNHLIEAKDSLTGAIVLKEETKSIADRAFADCNNITSIDVSSNLHSIGYEAFYGCSNLGAIAIPDTITTIGERAFYNCYSLSNVEIGSGLTYAGAKLFYGCKSLKSLSIPFIGEYRNVSDSTSVLGYYFGSSSFTGSYSVSQVYSPGNSITYYIPNSLTTVVITDTDIIPDGAFEDCTTIKNIMLPNTIKAIGNRAFYTCRGLSDLELPNTIETIGNYALAYCSGLPSLTIPSNVTAIGEYAFSYCTSLGKISIPHRITYISNGAFYNCHNLTDVTLHNNIIGIGEFAFAYCSELNSIDIPKNTDYIGRSAFRDCSNLKNVSISRSVKDIEQEAFLNCNSISRVSIEDLSAWCDINFSNWSSNPAGYAKSLYLNDLQITNLVIPDGVSAIKKYAFYKCTSLISVTIPGSVVSVGGSSFESIYFSKICIVNSSCEIYDSSYTFRMAANGYICGYPSSTAEVYANAYNRQFLPICNCEDYACNYSSQIISATCTSQGYTAYLCNDCGYSYNCSYLDALPHKYGSWTSINGENHQRSCDCGEVDIQQHNWEIASVIVQPTHITVGEAEYVCHSCSAVKTDSVPTIIEHSFNDWVPFTGAEHKSTCICGAIQTESHEWLGSTCICGVYSGTCGTNAYWSFDPNTGTLTILGNGEINEYYYSFPWAFACNEIKTVEIYEGITYISKYAFRNFENLTCVTMADSVKSIGDSAFWQCTNLEAITLPKTMERIGTYAFYGCSSLKSINIPMGLTVIEDSTFRSCDGLMRVNVPEGIVSIGESAFSLCSSLIDINIPESVNQISDEAFYYCSSLTDISLPNTVTIIGEYAFYGCTNLVDINIPAGLDIISEGMLGSSGITDISIPHGVSVIDDKAFWHCNYLESVSIPESVTCIGNNAFEYCGKLINLYIPYGVFTLGNYAFSGCYHMEGVSIPGSITVIGNSAFRNCNRLVEINISNGVVSVDDYAFYGCSALTSITLPDSIDKIGLSAFAKCMKLNMVRILNPLCEIDDKVDTLGNSANTIICGNISSTSEAYALAHSYQFYPLCNCEDYSCAYEVDVVSPTCTENGYTVAVCEKCNYSYVTAVTNALGHSYVNGICTCGQKEDKDPIEESTWKLGHTLNLASDISINIVISKSALTGFDMDTVYVESRLPVYEGNAQNGEKTIRLEPVENGNYYYFIVSGLSAVQMNNSITSVLYGTKDGQKYYSPVDEYSIATYAYSQLNKEGISSSLKKLCADLLRYGANAQIYKGYRTDDLADSAMSEAHWAYLSDIENITFGNTNLYLEDLDNAQITWVGKALNLDSKVELKFVFNAKNYNGELTDLSLQVSYTDAKGNSKTVSVENWEVYNENLGYYSFTLDALLAAELRTVVSVRIYAGNTPVSCTLQYTADTYGNNKTGALGDLCRALFAYSDSAKNYFNG